MSFIDWVVLSATLLFIVIYGVWKTTGSKNIEGYLLGDNTSKWWSIGLSIMATQASAITFLSTPGQAYEDGMRFIQFYFGLPVAMVIISVTAVPIYSRLKVYTAYEYLESRFDLKTRSLAAFLFLIQRGLSTGITIYAPAIVLSAMLGWNLNITILVVGSVVILYTVTGGTKAVSVTQKFQMTVMMGGMVVAGIVIIGLLPDEMSLGQSVKLAGKMGKMNLVDFNFNLNDRYNFWSGIIGGTFLALSYFGTDQSQVARYLSGESITESRLGLLFNGLLKIPMQFMILFIGIMVFVFYQFNKPPLFFNKAEVTKVNISPYAAQFKQLEKEHEVNFQKKQVEVNELVQGLKSEDKGRIKSAQQNIAQLQSESMALRKETKDLVLKTDANAKVTDTDYIFITFVLDHMPRGLVGLLLAVILCAAMSSTASALNALASTTIVDIYKRSVKKEASDKHYLNASKGFTLLWGIIAILFALVASMLENLIQAVNILGSLFYGIILGIFLGAFYFKFIKSNAIFIGALIAEAIVLICYFTTEISYLWYNVIGCFLVVGIAFFIQILLPQKTEENSG